MPECANCGKSFKIKFRGGKKYCSEKCRKKFYDKPKPVKKCENCGKKFTGRRTKYCSEFCRKKAKIAKMTESRKVDFEAVKPKVMKPKTKPKLSLEEVAKLANDAGLTYGQYVGKHGL